jgi:hypothetical protein
MRLVDFDKKILEKIYHNGFSKIPLSKSQAIIHKGGVDMKFNSYGFRSPEFTTDLDFLFGGCSVTEGWGLSKNNVWANRLMSDLGGRYASVAKAGDSINGQVRKIFAYINKYGNPKNIICLFPPFERIQVFVNKDLFTTEPFDRVYKKDFFESAILDLPNNYSAMEYINSLYIDASVSKTSIVQNKKEYFKRPLMAEDVIPVEMAHMYSSQSIHFLSQYCKNAGINFVWGTWDHGTDSTINLMKYNNYFKEHIDMNIYKFDYDYDLKIDTVKDPDDNILDCHLENKDDPEFHLALDVQNGVHNAHFGSHRHLHYYETFLKHIRGTE